MGAASAGLLDSGYRVVLAGRRAEPLASVAADGPAGSTLVVPTDVGRPADVWALFDRARERFGRVDRRVATGLSDEGRPRVPGRPDRQSN